MHDNGDDHEDWHGDDWRGADSRGAGMDAPICSACGVTALPSESMPDAFVCENPDCDAGEM